MSDKLNNNGIAYIVKMYPRFSETFIVNEILAHEAANVPITIVSLRKPTDGRFHNILSLVKAPVHYIDEKLPGTETFWDTAQQQLDTHPELLDSIRSSAPYSARELWQAIQVVELISKLNIRHLHAHFANTAAMVAKLASTITGLPYSVTTHAKDIYNDDVRDNVFHSKIKTAKACITVSDFNLDYLKKRYSNAAHHIHRVYNGLDLSRFEFLNSTKKSIDIIAVGRLVEKKGFRYLIDACALLKKRNIKFNCQIVGTGALKGQLQNQIAELELSGEVQLTGPLPQSEIIQRIGRSRLMVAPCIIADDGNRDGLPTVLLEAMALGTPCISTSVTGIPELIRHNDTGLLVEPNDSEQLASTIENLLCDYNFQNHLATNARALIEDSFDVHKNTQHLRKLILGNSVAETRRNVPIFRPDRDLNNSEQSYENSVHLS